MEIVSAGYQRVALVFGNIAADRYVIARYLRLVGFNVIEMPDSVTKDTALNYSPDLVVIDLECASENTASLSRELNARHDRARIPIITVSQKVSQSEKAMPFIRCFSDSHLEKPILKDKLFALVNCISQNSERCL
ncbi:MAG: hypothetical protein EOP06_00190 [Proteobacteria bacterium]|nr:MAG: hypothetical protein EOP06_00190 [Pseudomonadota bacterium]